MTDGVITIVARDTDDGTAISAVVGEPLNKTYTGQVQGGQIVLLIPAADLVSALSTTPLTTYTLDNDAGDPDVVVERFRVTSVVTESPDWIDTTFGEPLATSISAITVYEQDRDHRYRYRAAGSTVDQYSVEDTSTNHATHTLGLSGLIAETSYDIWPQSRDSSAGDWYDMAGPFNEVTAAVSTSTAVQVFNSTNLVEINSDEDVTFASTYSDAGYTEPPSGPGEVMRTIVGAGDNRGSSRVGYLEGDDVIDAELSFEHLMLADGPTSGNFKWFGLAGETDGGGNGGQGGSDTDGTNAWSARGEFNYTNTASSDWWLTTGSEIYHQDDRALPSGFGQTVWNTTTGAISGPNPAKITLGIWDVWKQRVRVNDVGQYNGIVQWYKNDALVYERTNFRFSQVERHRRIHKFWAIVYHGGTANSTSNESRFYFANMRVNILETRPGNAV